MRNLIVSASLIAAAVAVSGCATHETAKFDAAQSLGDGSSWDASYSSEQAGENSYSWGDKYTAANLFLQADKADNSIKNRFNLAAAFASIGKTGMAREIYASLVVDGRFTRLSEDTRQGDPTWTKSFNVGQESQNRLLALDALAPVPTRSLGASGTGQTNEAARVLDQNAQDERGHSLNRKTVVAPSTVAPNHSFAQL